MVSLVTNIGNAMELMRTRTSVSPGQLLTHHAASGGLNPKTMRKRNKKLRQKVRGCSTTHPCPSHHIAPCRLLRLPNEGEFPLFPASNGATPSRRHIDWLVTLTRALALLPEVLAGLDRSRSNAVAVFFSFISCQSIHHGCNQVSYPSKHHRPVEATDLIKIQDL